MNAVYQATLNVARDSFAMLREAVDGLPDEAMDWRPAGNANSLHVLTLHSISATRFLVRAGSGEAVSITAYREDDRAPAFASAGRSAAELVEAINAFVEEFEGLLKAGDTGVLEKMVEFPEDPSQNKNGAQCLIHALAHLREHVGQAQLTRDLWLARNG